VTHRLEITCAAVDGGAETVAPHSLGLTRKTTTVQATAQSLPISVLDLVPTRPGEPAGRAIARSVELARHLEQLEYKRYWVAEHHAIQGLACSATPVLIGHIPTCSLAAHHNAKTVSPRRRIEHPRMSAILRATGAEDEV